MSTQHEHIRAGTPTRDDARRRLLATMPMSERRLDCAGVATAVLEGGDGRPLVLLHGRKS